MAVSTARRPVATRLQLAAFAAVAMRLQFAALAFRHGVNRAHYDFCPIQCPMTLASHVRMKLLPSVPQQPTTLLHWVRLRRSRGMRPLSVSLDGVPRPRCFLHCLTACATGTDCLGCCRCRRFFNRRPEERGQEPDDTDREATGLRLYADLANQK